MSDILWLLFTSAAAFFLVAFCVSSLNVSSQAKKAQLLQGRIRTAVKTHINALTRKRKQFIFFDDYGNEDRTKWDREIAYFVNKVLMKDPELAQNINDGKLFTLKDYDTELRRVPTIHEWLDRIIVESIEPSTAILMRDDMTGHEYEHFCATLLEEEGWKVQVTKASGDQGADIVAEQWGQRWVFQCKKWAGSVGNGAVQEVSAARHFQGAEGAAVITSSTFTKAARELANATGVILLHHSDISIFSNNLRQSQLQDSNSA